MVALRSSPLWEFRVTTLLYFGTRCKSEPGDTKTKTICEQF